MYKTLSQPTYMEDPFLHERLHSNYPLDCLPRPFAMAASKREKPIQCGKLTFNLPSQKTSSIFFLLPPNHRLVHLPGDTCTFFAGLILVETLGNSFYVVLTVRTCFIKLKHMASAKTITSRAMAFIQSSFFVTKMTFTYSVVMHPLTWIS